MDDRRFHRFIGYLVNNEAASNVAAQLQREGVDLRRSFIELVVYLEGRSVAPERKRRGKRDRAIINQGVRQNGVSPEVGRWLLDRAELAHATNGLGLAHNIDSLAGLHIYLELKTGRRVTMGELAYLVEAANHALQRRPLSVDPNTIAHELRRHRQKNPRFLEILRADIASRL